MTEQIQTEGDQWSCKGLFIDGLNCSSCLLGVESSLDKILPKGTASFVMGTHFLKFSEPVCEKSLTKIEKRLQQLGYYVFQANQSELFERAAKKRIENDAKSLVFLGFFSTWINTLAWVVYLSEGSLGESEERTLHLLMALGFVPIALKCLPNLVSSCWRSFKIFRWHIDFVILSGAASAMILAAKSFIEKDFQHFYLDSTSMSLFLVFAARLFSSAKRTKIPKQLHENLDATPTSLQKVDRTLGRTMETIFISSMIYTAAMLLIFSKNITFDLFFSMFLTWPLTACPCLLMVFTELSNSLGFDQKKSQFSHHINSIFVGTFNITTIFQLINLQLSPKILSTSMLLLIVVLAVFNTSIYFLNEKQ